jgi:predicted ATPase
MAVSIPQVYLSYASADENRAVELYDRLSEVGFKPWLFAKEIRPGEDWLAAADQAMRRSDFFLTLLSKHSTERQGFFEREWQQALQIQADRGPGTIYLIPVRLEECDVPESLARFLWVDLYKPDGWDRLVASLQRTAVPRLPQPKPPAELIASLKKGDCVMFAGAGLSRPAGLPLWRDLVIEMLDLAVQHEVIPAGLGQSFRISLEGGSADSVADSLASIFREKFPKGGPLEEYLRKRFLNPAIQSTAYHSQLGRIGFSAALTTNFDDLLERTFPQATGRIYTARDAAPLLDNLAQPEQFFILKLVGTPDRPESLLVSPGQFRDAVESDPLLRQFFERLFFSRTVLFLGASLAGIQSNLDALHIRPTGVGRVHYALVGVAGQEWQAEADLLKRRYNVQVLPYTLGDPSQIQPDALEFLKALSAKGVARKGSTRQEQARLKRVLLENIGPFEKLELELHPTWNVLLGDNGVGKSNILRAIALAYCGEAAAPWAARMLRYGASRGRVTLQSTDGDQREVELTRPSRTSREVVVKVQATRNLETQPGLVIGFPALRQLGWQPVTGPEPKPGTAYTVPEDLLPLLRGEPDPRMQDLKKSIVDLDFLRSQEGAEANARQRDEQKFSDLFHVFQKMAEGLKLRYVGFDRKTSQILVETDDGKVPIEMVSQGTQSLMGWVGILLERLYDVYPDDPRPRGQTALVAIDEIDAHMHPLWQQVMVSNLSELFPRTQFIASTHSPLIVSGMPVEQIFRLNRQRDGTIALLQVDSDMTMGRTDQVLTSDLFQLTTTLDPETERQIQTYQNLLAKGRLRSAAEENEFRRLAKVLEFRVPVSAETLPARRAEEMLDALLDSELGDRFPETQAKLREKARRLLAAVEAERERP